MNKNNKHHKEEHEEYYEDNESENALVVVVTGASSGIGRATAIEFARQGHSVVLAARREDALEELAQECERIGGEAFPVPTDVSIEENVEALARAAVDEYGRIDVWVNNAAVSLFGRLEEVPMEDIRRVIDVNLFGYIYGARAAIRRFREQGEGVLINVSSVVGIVGQPYTIPYSLSKFAIRGLSLSLEQELKNEKNIHVCTVLPSVVDTPLFQQAANYTGADVKPPKPIISAEKVADAIVYLAEHPQREMVVGRMGKFAALARSIAPEFFDKRYQKQLRSSHFKEASSEPYEGNLYDPDEEYETISGGWKKDSIKPALSNKKLLKVGLGIGAATLGAVLLYKIFTKKRKRSEDEYDYEDYEDYDEDDE